ncbi:MAG TPA: 1-deoxy-D-xylulose-5-phosphate reductoisomerase [Bacteroidales bacterium]|nr:1-deoxy-D-xylulose-5-phosphate reductoisomerase [Bacteroidales bacterium]
MNKQLAILGSTGSIGQQALEVVRRNPQRFGITVLTAHSNYQLLIQQALEFKPKVVVIGCSASATVVREALKSTGIEVLAGNKHLETVVTMPEIDQVLVALVGVAALTPLVAAIKAHKSIALANKEALVVAGDIVMRLGREHQVPILPVDSEHSAIFQCLQGEQSSSIEKIYLTASGGPFFGKSVQSLRQVTPEQALCHPNWNMGSKITIDSATMMNKGLEVIEAKWLFDLEPHQIEVVVHPQSVVHSIVQFTDGSMKAQMGLPDMKLPIQYALAYPERIAADFGRFSFMDVSKLTFASPDEETFRSLRLARQALLSGGNLPCILNAANETAVEAFLKHQIGFVQIPEIIEQTMDKGVFIANPSLDELIETNRLAKNCAKEIIKSKEILFV